MPYSMLPDESVNAAIRRICAKQIDHALADIDDPALDRDGTVHEVRKRCKKIRGALRLVRGSLSEGDYARENARFRDAARELSSIRDAGVLIETYDALAERYGDETDLRALVPVRKRLSERRARIAGGGTDLDAELAAFRTAVAEARPRVRGLDVDGDGFAALESGFAKTYRRARKGLRAAYEAPTAERFHDWRKRVKYHGYHCRLLEGVWPPVVDARYGQVSRLSDLLGTDHDLVVFEDVLKGEPEVFGDLNGVEPLVQLAGRWRAELRDEARPLGERLFVEKPRVIGKRLAGYWSVWQTHSGAVSG